MKQIYLSILIGLITTQCQLPESKQQTTSTDQQKAEQVKPKVNWQYNEDEDKMSNQKRYSATTESTNELEFEFPYNGGSTFNLYVRNIGTGNEVILEVSKGQFMPGYSDSESLRVKFDDEAPFNVSYNSASDASLNVIFLNNSKKIISKLKLAKKLMVEAPFFNAGRKIIYFDVEGLTWEH